MELNADYWELVGSSPAGGAENLVNEESLPDVQLDQRHMMLRGDKVRGGATSVQGEGSLCVVVHSFPCCPYSCPGSSSSGQPSPSASESTTSPEAMLRCGQDAVQLLWCAANGRTLLLSRSRPLRW